MSPRVRFALIAAMVCAVTAAACCVFLVATARTPFYPPRPVPTVTVTARAAPAAAVTVTAAPAPAVTRTVTQAAPFTVPCAEGANVSLIVGEKPAGATGATMACSVSVNPDWGGLTVTAPDGLTQALTTGP